MNNDESRILEFHGSLYESINQEETEFRLILDEDSYEWVECEETRKTLVIMFQQIKGTINIIWK